MGKVIESTPPQRLDGDWRIPLTAALLQQLGQADEAGLELVDLEHADITRTIRFIFVEKRSRCPAWRPPLAYHLYCYESGGFLGCLKAVHLVFNSGSWVHNTIGDGHEYTFPNRGGIAPINAFAALLLRQLCTDTGRLSFFVGGSCAGNALADYDFICNGLAYRSAPISTTPWFSLLRLRRGSSGQVAITPVSYMGWQLLRRQVPPRSMLSNLHVMTPDNGESARQFHLPSCYKLSSLAAGQRYNARNASAWLKGVPTFDPDAYTIK